MRPTVRSVLAFVAVCAAAGRCDAAPVPRTVPPKPLPAEVVAAWKKAGAEVGWMSPGGTGFRAGETGQPGEIPAFRFPNWAAHHGGFGGKGQFGRGGFVEAVPPLELPVDLPAPEQSFGLHHSGCRLPDHWVKELVRFNRLYALTLGGSDYFGGGGVTTVTDTDLVHIGQLSELRVLRIGRVEISDTGFRHLTRLAHLRVLDVPDARLSEDGLDVLGNFRELEELNVSNSRVNEAVAGQLAKLSQLRLLTVSNTGLTDAGMRHLAGLIHLRHLGINGTAVTAAGLKHLARMTELRCRCPK